jgi:hypothetical protein
LEYYTVRLAFCVIRHLLYYTQSRSAPHIVEARLHERLSIEKHKGDRFQAITAIDDGGLCLRVKASRLVVSPYYVLIEAKRQLLVVNNRPVVSDEVLAQMTCEAIAARAARMEKDEESGDYVFVINASQYSMRILQFHITELQIREIQQEQTPSEALEVHATRWFDISDRIDRRLIRDNICQLVQYPAEKI